jgi:hypothetical protein
MSKPKTTRFAIDLVDDLADAVARAAAEAAISSEEFISECVSQHCETALRHRVLIQRQNDVDEALLELARLVGRLSAGTSEPPANICRYHAVDAE